LKLVGVSHFRPFRLTQIQKSCQYKATFKGYATRATPMQRILHSNSPWKIDDEGFNFEGLNIWKNKFSIKKINFFSYLSINANIRS
jgi:hypothetical protein